ncbi:MAG: methylated-DNA--[protein]-cysteine S-methyltransferase [Candidatus Binatus sp.]|uniref:methylated-DNA--[protein]-cysteine S-methyltransferase n=1 Tax=Candidatus Binatus sp. TaxID=2811406 RepID=UPI0027198C55|nr:methylated-DNA--[protein]-cysteine S-methyltransferase [Candidatus Binatus sp.]MDO8432836.1 methylated-DNA--[protein]-cysteine S-methyltransferase [Candidatus Binatus sp.]
MELFIDRIPSPIGTVLIVSDGTALNGLDFGDHEDRMMRLMRLHYGACTLKPMRNPAGLRDRIEAYFARDFAALDDIIVQTGGTPFQKEVWAELRRIPLGATTTYGELAAKIGRPKSSRAVGMANGSNPVGIVVPCHRVIGAGGALTGYGGGIDRKRWLLEHEGAHLRLHSPPAPIAEHLICNLRQTEELCTFPNPDLSDPLSKDLTHEQ